MSDSDKKNPNSKNPSQHSTDDNDSKASGRRKLLKAGGVVATSALIPEKWQKPVVDSVILPTHAQTSTPLIGPVIIAVTEVTPSAPPATMAAESDSGILDAFVSPSWAGGATATTPSPTPSPTPVATPAPTPGPTPMTTPGPTPMTTPGPTPSPTGCSAAGQCAGLAPPNGDNQVAFSITNVGAGLLNMTGPLTYQGTVSGLTVSGFFTDQTYSSSQGTITGLGCNASYSATLGGVCTPAA